MIEWKLHGVMNEWLNECQNKEKGEKMNDSVNECLGNVMLNVGMNVIMNVKRLYNADTYVFNLYCCMVGLNTLK